MTDKPKNLIQLAGLEFIEDKHSPFGALYGVDTSVPLQLRFRTRIMVGGKVVKVVERNCATGETLEVYGPGY